MQNSITLKSYAKINLTLDIVGKKSNGYHNLWTIMQEVSLCDLVSINVEKSSENSVKISCSDEKIPSDFRNIAYKSAVEFLSETQLSDRFSVKIHIEKNIPSEAGLGGGSSNAACVLKGLNTLFETGFSNEKLAEIGVKIGADVPFFIYGGIKLCEGIGEIISEFPKIPDCYFVIAKGNEGISTKSAFEKMDKLADFGNYPKIQKFSSDAKLFAGECYNIFDKYTENEEVSNIKEIILKSGGLSSVMSGSGSAVYGVFDNERYAKSCVDELLKLGFFATICKAI